MILRVFTVTCVLSVFVLSGCSGGDSSSSVGCASGETEDCLCGSGALGARTCQSDGTFN